MSYGLHRIFGQSATPAAAIPQLTSVSALKRSELAHRLVNIPSVADYLHRAQAATPHNTKSLILATLSYEHPIFNELIDKVIRKAEEQGPAAIVAAAEKAIADFRDVLKVADGSPNDVNSFFKRNTFGEFDPQQFLLVNSLGAAKSDMDAYDNYAGKPGAKKFLQKSIARIEQTFTRGYLLLRAAEISSAR